MPLPLTSLINVVAALAVVLGLVLLSAKAAKIWGFSRRGTAAPGKRMALRESLPLDRARRLQIVCCDDREIVLLTGGPTDLIVGWLPPTITGMEGQP